MARKKKESYNDMLRIVSEMRTRMQQEKERMSKVMAAALLDGMTETTAARLGDYTDADLRRLMALVASDIGKYASALDAEKQAQEESKRARKEVQEQPEQSQTGGDDNDFI